MEVTQLQSENLLGKRFGVQTMYRLEDNTNIVFEEINVLCFERKTLRRIFGPVCESDGDQDIMKNSRDC